MRSFISAAERALIQSAVQSGAEILSLEGAPGFRFVPCPTLKLVDEPPRKRSLSFKRKPHMRGIKSWSPKPLTWGPADYRGPMCGDPPELTDARRAWADGDPEPLRSWLAANKRRERLNASEFKAIRNRAGLTQAQLARLLRISEARSIRKWESGEREISGPVSILMEMLDRGELH